KVAARWNLEALLLRGSVHRGGNDLPVPVDQLRRVCLVEQINGYGDSLAQANQRSGHRAVVSDGAYGVSFRDVGQHGADTEGQIRLACQFGFDSLPLSVGRAIAAVQKSYGGYCGTGQKIAA